MGENGGKCGAAEHKIKSKAEKIPHISRVGEIGEFFGNRGCRWGKIG